MVPTIQKLPTQSICAPVRPLLLLHIPNVGNARERVCKGAWNFDQGRTLLAMHRRTPTGAPGRWA